MLTELLVPAVLCLDSIDSGRHQPFDAALQPVVPSPPPPSLLCQIALHLIVRARRISQTRLAKLRRSVDMRGMAG